MLKIKKADFTRRSVFGLVDFWEEISLAIKGCFVRSREKLGIISPQKFKFVIY